MWDGIIDNFLEIIDKFQKFIDKCLCHLLDQNFFGRPKFNFDQPKQIWPAKTIKILYKNEGPKSFGQPNIFLAGQKYFGQADGIGISQKKYEFIHIFHCVFSILAVLLQCMGASCFGKGMKREASTFMLSQQKRPNAVRWAGSGTTLGLIYLHYKCKIQHLQAYIS